MSEHDISNIDDRLLPLVDAIVHEVNPDRIVLFGSWARGEAGPNSDIDLLIVSATPYGPGHSRRREAARLYRRLAGAGVPKDLLLASRVEVERWQGSPSHVLARALKEGRVIYERS